MDTLTAELTPSRLADILQEPEKALLGRVLKMLGQERCAQVLADTLSTEAAGGLMLKDGSRRRTQGGVFFQLVRQQCTPEERARLFPYRVLKRPSSSAGDRPPTSVHRQAPQAPALAPIALTLDQWKGLRPMHVTATLKLVLRDIPDTRESNGLVYMALQNEPRGLPQNISLDKTPLYLTSPVKQWKTACAKAAEIRATGTPALLILEAHVSTREGAIIGVVKGVQVAEGKAPVATPTA